MGSKTGRDGIHGAYMRLLNLMKIQMKKTNCSRGDPFTEKL